MKLGVKIFFGIMIPFGVILLCGGYFLLSFFYDTTMNREIQAAWEQYQYNKFVVQSEILTKGKSELSENDWDSDTYEEFGGEVALFSRNFSEVYNGFEKKIDFNFLLRRIEKNEKNYEFIEVENTVYLMMSGLVEENDTSIYLVTGINMESVLELWQEMKDKVIWLYFVAIIIGIVLSACLSVMFTKPIRTLMSGAERIANGKYGEQTNIQRKDEIGQLAEHFDKMSYAVQEKVEKLSDAARQREDFVANFSHELKTPLTSIVGYAERIYKKDLTSGEIKQAAWYIWNEGMRLETLSRKLMDMILLERNDFILETVRIDSVFNELSQDVIYQLTEKNISMESELEAASVKIEYDLFKSLFYNLLDNAIKANSRHIFLKGSLNRDMNLYQIEMIDDGNGIPPEEMGRITEAFYMVDKSRSRKMHGAGLGLALSKKIAEIHGSTLEFESDGKYGTKVIFYLQSVEDMRNE